MRASVIRDEGIAAPGNSYCGGPNDHGAIAQNIGILCGIGLEIAAQLAEANNPTLIEFQSPSGPVWINPRAIMTVISKKPEGSGTYIFMGGGDEEYVMSSQPIEEVLKKLRE